jgi:hypothetical protein
MPTRKKKSTHKKRKQLLKRTSLTEREYKHLRGKSERKFREKSLELRDKNFIVEIFRKMRIKKKKKYVHRYVKIGASEFIPNREYKIYIKHKPSGQRRLLGIGKFRDIPIRSKHIDRFSYQLGGRTFDPSLKYPKRAKGKWVPVDRIVAGIQREIQEIARDAGSEARGAIIPLKRYFHTDWLIYSDKVLKGNTLIHKAFVNCAVQFIYPNADWIGKQSLFVEFKRGVRLNKLHTLIPRLERRLNDDLELLHGNAENVSLIEVNGFIPIGI